MEREKFYGLDHLRAVAILLVLLYHYRMFEHPAWIDTIGWVGWTGVDLFFVLSGFLISSQLFGEISQYGTIRLKSFFTKRFFRIIPPYALTLLLYFCFPAFREREALPPLWKFLSFTQNYGLNVIDNGTFSHAWSLCIEEQFYLVLPLSLLLLVRLKAMKYVKSAILFLLILTMLLRFFFWAHAVLPLRETPEFWKAWYMKIYYPTYTRLDGLAIGVLMGYWYQFSSRFKAIIHTNGNLLTVAGVLAIVFSLWFCKDQYSAQASVFGFTLVAASYGLLVAGALSRSSFLGRNPNMITSQLAVLSYAIYLSHKGIIHLVQRFLDQYNIPVSDTIVLLLCLISCVMVGAAVPVYHRKAVCSDQK
ncbi:acyltransferase [Chryseobacterium sp. SORGH_AS_1048]|uniref:acyltransferase family protein n=1 Tax=Chryseobacterium sp. SORGH_AS_1048 TaxID=3041783 RepID=UPI002780DF78|nr:acyltransferase [Chryseobacterium sp. SORGH_AS_1048]MDQ1099784.1 peptidoglycan/LPS O-acetylase OafA/YrhL [Chryseobacterium sp. SORGH_AS_1048]